MTNFPTRVDFYVDPGYNYIIREGGVVNVDS